MEPRRYAPRSPRALRTLSTLALAVGLVAVAPRAALAVERILSFSSEITVNADASLDVRETIRVAAENVEIRHGIYRDFPTRYRDRTGGYEVTFEVTEVQRDGADEPWHTEGQSNGVRVYIGDKDRLVAPGEHTYVLGYRTERQLGFFADHDELYWNVTGNGWVFPIESAEARVRLPRGAEGVRLEGYTGPQGAKGQDFASAWEGGEGGAVFRSTRPFGPHEGLTIVVMWPKGLVHEPTQRERALWYAATNRAAIFGLVGLLAVLGFYLWAWFRVGRDPERGTIVPLYAAPAGLSPAAVRYLKELSFDHRAFAATVLQMAVKGHLVIEEHDKEFTLRQLPDPGKAKEPLAAEEAAVAAKLFGSGSSIELKQANHVEVAGAVTALRTRLSGQLEKVYFVLNRSYLVTGVLLSLLVIGATLFLTRGSAAAMSGFFSIWLLFWSLGVGVLGHLVWTTWRDVVTGAGKLIVNLPRALFLTAFATPFFAGELFGIGMLVWQGSAAYAAVILGLAGLSILFHHLLKAPTSAGRKLLDRIEGFELYLKAAESDRFRLLGSPERTPALYERFLPYAVALDLEERWSEAFTDVLAKATAEGQAYSPAWYHGSWGGSGWSPSSFAGMVGGSLSGAISSASTAPGSSSGGGGGGSSGGGGGGGGGGGW